MDTSTAYRYEHLQDTEMTEHLQVDEVTLAFVVNMNVFSQVPIEKTSPKTLI